MKLLFLLAVGISFALAGSGMAAETSKGTGKLRHVVAFKFKEDATEAQIKKVVDSFRALKGKISEIKAFEWGTNNSPEGFNKGTTHAFVLTFESEKDRDAYLVHPEHKKFAEGLGPVVGDVFVIDYWAHE